MKAKNDSLEEEISSLQDAYSRAVTGKGCYVRDLERDDDENEEEAEDDLLIHPSASGASRRSKTEPPRRESRSEATEFHDIGSPMPHPFPIYGSADARSGNERKEKEGDGSEDVPRRKPRERSRTGRREKRDDPTSGSDDSDAEEIRTTKSKAKEADSLKFEPFPKVTTFRTWRMQFKKTAAAGSKEPEACFKWLCEVEKKGCTMQDLESSGKFETLDIKIAAGLTTLLNGEFQRQIQLLDEEYEREGKMVKGRQIALKIYQHFKISELAEGMLNIQDLLAVELKNDNLRAFLTDWELTLSKMNPKEVPAAQVMENLFKTQLEKSDQLKNVITMYDHDVVHRGDPKDYEKLKTMLETHLNKRRQDRNRQALTNKNDGGGNRPRAYSAGAGNRKGKGNGKGGKGNRDQGGNSQKNNSQKNNNNKNNNAPKVEQGDCRQWVRTGKCFRGDNCSFNHRDEVKGVGFRSNSKSQKRGRDRSQKGDQGGNSQRQSRSRDRSSISQPKRGKSPSGRTDQVPCRDWMKGKCTKGKECDFWHVPNCRFFRVGNCSMGKECIFRHPPKGGYGNAASQKGDNNAGGNSQGNGNGNANAKPKAKSKAKGGANLASMTLAAMCTAALAAVPVADGCKLSLPMGFMMPVKFAPDTLEREFPSLGVIDPRSTVYEPVGKPIREDPEILRITENQAKWRAYELNKSCFPRETNFVDERRKRIFRRGEILWCHLEASFYPKSERICHPIIYY